MRTHSNTIFITGGSSGIGKGLAEAFHRLGNQVIISARPAGRGPMPLDAFIQEAMRELACDADEVAIAHAKNLVAASCPETVKKVFDSMNP